MIGDSSLGRRKHSSSYVCPAATMIKTTTSSVRPRFGCRGLVPRMARAHSFLPQPFAADMGDAPYHQPVHGSPRHLLAIHDLPVNALTGMIRKAHRLKWAARHGLSLKGFDSRLEGQTVALMFSKLSTRTRVSTEAAVVAMGGHPLFLGKNDIQLGVCKQLGPRTCKLDGLR